MKLLIVPVPGLCPSSPWTVSTHVAVSSRKVGHSVSHWHEHCFSDTTDTATGEAWGLEWARLQAFGEQPEKWPNQLMLLLQWMLLVSFFWVQKGQLMQPHFVQIKVLLSLQNYIRDLSSKQPWAWVIAPIIDCLPLFENKRDGIVDIVSKIDFPHHILRNIWQQKCPQVKMINGGTCQKYEIN